MENINAASTRSPVSKTRHDAAAAVLRRCGEMLIDLLKSVWASWCEVCSGYWIGANPAIWGIRK